MRSDAECGVAEQGKREGSPIEQERGHRKFNLIEIINKRMSVELGFSHRQPYVQRTNIQQSTFQFAGF